MKVLRRMRMGLATVLGVRAQGFFSPYRYADRVQAPAGYPELEPVFAAAEPSMAAVLDEIDRHGAALAALAGPPPRPRWDQSWFARLDGAATYAIVRRAAPRTVIEVGSGHSTRMLCQALGDAGGMDGARVVSIDPAPRADIASLGVEQHRRVLATDDIARFAALGAGDVAFFDSSHVLWPGSDVDLILNRILPVLRPGVLVHVHDVLLPDPYPEAWAWRGYTEQNALAGWLFGGAEVVFASHYALTRMNAAARPGIAGLPLPPAAHETSLWLRRK